MSFKKWVPIVAIIVGLLGASALGTASSKAAALSPLLPIQVIQTHASLLVGGKHLNEFQKNGIKARNKYNPNEALLGTMLGGARAYELNGTGYLPARHYAYCMRRYGSYRAKDNTFLSFDLVREQCESPYLPKN